MKCTAKELPSGTGLETGGVVGGTVGGTVGGVLGGVVGGTVDGVLGGVVGGTVDGVLGGVVAGAELGGVISLPGWEMGTLEDGILDAGVLPELGASVGTQISYSGMGAAQPARSTITSSQLAIIENSFLFFIRFSLFVNFKSIIPFPKQKVKPPR